MAFGAPPIADQLISTLAEVGAEIMQMRAVMSFVVIFILNFAGGNLRVEYKKLK